jgi:hypothetical protein
MIDYFDAHAPCLQQAGTADGDETHETGPDEE